MDEIQQLAAQLKTNPDNLEAWRRLSQHLDDPQKKQDCLNQVTRIENKQRGFDETILCEKCGAWMSVFEDHLLHQKAASCRLCGIRKVLETYDQGHNEVARQDTVTILVLIVSILGGNFLPVIGVLYLNWDVGNIVILYWLENLILGFFITLKFLSTRMPAVIKAVAASTFSLPYVVFWLFHGLVIMILFTPDFPDITGWLTRLFGTAWSVLGMFISHGIAFVQNRNEYSAVMITKFVSQLYARLFPLHIALILGAFVIMKSGETVGALVFLIALKTLVELFPIGLKLVGQGLTRQTRA